MFIGFDLRLGFGGFAVGVDFGLGLHLDLGFAVGINFRGLRIGSRLLFGFEAGHALGLKLLFGSQFGSGGGGFGLSVGSC